MKKIYLLIPTFLLALNLDASAQRNTTENEVLNVKTPFIENQNQAKKPNLHQITSRDEIVIWSSDFSDEDEWLIGAESDNTTGNDWVICYDEDDCDGPVGDFAIAPINSTTASNGYAMYDSDGVGNGGSIQNAWIRTADPISLEDVTGAVVVRFEQFYRKFLDQTFVEVSTNGTTWTTFEVNAAVPVNGATSNPSVREVNVAAAVEDADQMWIRFRFEGGWDYAWMIDDVEIITTAEPNIEIEETYYTDHWASVTYDWENEEISIYHINGDVAMIAPIKPRLILQNNGGVNLTNVICTATILGPNGFEEVLTSAPRNVNIGARDTLITAEWDMPTTADIGDYTINYSIASEQEFDSSVNTTANQSFRISDWEYGKDLGVSDGVWQNTTGNGNTSGNYRIGPGFYMFTDATLYGAGFNLGNGTTVGNLFSIEVYDFDYNGTNPESYLDGVDVTSTAEMVNEWTWIEFDSEVELDQDEGYVIYLSFLEEGTGEKVFINLSGNSAPLSNFLRFISADGNFYITRRPMIRMMLDNTTISVPEIKAGEIVSQNAFPNPFEGNLEIQYTLANDANVQFELYDVTGKLINSSNEGRIASGVVNSISLNGFTLNSGIYFYTLIIDGERVTQKIVKR